MGTEILTKARMTVIDGEGGTDAGDSPTTAIAA
jgi:hypothetical protein